ncbi:MAG: histidine triad nucleotide-binding protein [Thiotrichaceae bacterium]|nr:histidine triad nucleotide-binding protein [Thiotrichaceae bacterium]
MSDCLFCKIVAGKIPAKIRYENDDVLIFDDIEGQAPLHCLVIPKKHIATLNDLTLDNHQLIAKMYLAVKEFAKQEGIAEQGYRTVINCGEQGGQTVYHIHLHLLSGRNLQWPPG